MEIADGAERGLNRNNDHCRGDDSGDDNSTVVFFVAR